MKHEMASFNERYKAAMVLSVVGDSLGYRNGQWLECTSGRQIYEELMEQSLDEINIKPPEWRTSACTIMHNSTSMSLARWEYKTPNKALFQDIATAYSKYVKDIEARHPDETCLNSCKILLACKAVDKYIIPFNVKGTSNAASVRTMCVGLMYHNPNDLDRLIAISVECGRMTHHHPTGYLGALTTALFTSFAIQRKPIEQWGRALLKTLPMALDYIRETGIAVSENVDSFGHFTKVWKKHLKLRNIASDKLQTNPYDRFNFEKNDEYYRSVSLDGNPGSSGFDAPLIAYDAILSCNGNWLDLCVGAICHGGHSNVTGCIAACWYGALYAYEGVNECNYSKAEFKTK
ncbi:ADP-ribosylhydrolase ARH1-like [Mercenaria mercenaria]|uniref:ADP-ribosylhydrolase ARH1-like n=1 Tax=Mercenaria mercenaria TaxID=6596 RepID=UPI001E1D380D|nr:ADP-ribosylhydrolase ARH1-like [Mercenaria mercenaria]